MCCCWIRRRCLGLHHVVSSSVPHIDSRRCWFHCSVFALEEWAQGRRSRNAHCTLNNWFQHVSTIFNLLVADISLVEGCMWFCFWCRIGHSYCCKDYLLTSLCLSLSPGQKGLSRLRNIQDFIALSLSYMSHELQPFTVACLCRDIFCASCIPSVSGSFHPC